MINIKGVHFIKNNDYNVCYVNEFTDELKKLIKDNICMICNGKSASENPEIYNNYQNTVIELVKRIKGKGNSTLKIGMIGELLVHAIFTNYFTEYQSLSPFFNLEEGNIKKGFDLVLIKDNEIWINEVKSGNIHKDKNQDETIVELINNAKLDLKERLNNSDLNIWRNAINHAKIAYEKYDDEKDVIVNILNDIYSKTQCDSSQGKNANVFLTGVLFHDIKNNFSAESVKEKKESIDNEFIFKKVIVLAVQKSTCDAIINFLDNEAQGIR